MHDTAASFRHCVVGPGRLGTAVLHALLHAHEPVIAVGVGPTSVADPVVLPARLPVAEAVRVTMAASLGELPVVWLTVSDDAIATVAEQTAEAAGNGARGSVAVHCSGLGGLELLRPWERAGAEVVSLHPLQSFTFSAPEHANELLAGVPVAVTAKSARASHVGERLAVLVGGRPFALEEHDKPLYHLAATMASNLLVALESEACALLEQAVHESAFTSAPADSRSAAVLELLSSLLTTTARNLLEHGPGRALTGPVARGDTGTVRAHLALLEHQPERFRAAYRTLSLQALSLAAPRLDDEAVHTLRRLLGGFEGLRLGESGGS